MRSQSFGVTMETLLTLDSLAGAIVLGGAAGLGRVVTRVGRASARGRPLPGELVLAERLPWETDTVSEDFLREISVDGASGFGFWAGPHLPKSAVDAANRLSLPLFEVPREKPIELVVNQILASVLESQTLVLDIIQDLNHALTSTMLHGGSLQEISTILYQRFGNSVAISSDFLSSYVVNTTGEKRGEVCGFLEQEKLQTYLGHQLPANEVRRTHATLAGQPCDRLVIPIYSDNMLHGRIYMWEDFRPISGVEQSVLESATSLIALDMMKKMSVLHMENSNRGGFLADLLSGDQKQLKKALSNARSFGFERQAGHQVMVLRQRRRAEGAPSREATYQLNANVIRILQQAVRNTVVKVIYANQGSQIILLLESTPLGGMNLSRPTDDFLDALHSRFSQEGIEDFLVMGVGREYREVAELYRSLLEAKRALASPVPRKNGAVRFERIGIYRILGHEGIRTELESFCDEMLGPLLEYDRSKDARLTETLEQYFACACNLTRLAEKLGVHYNTACGRMQKIQSLTGMRLDDPRAALNLQVALRGHEIRRHEKADR